MAWPGLLHDSIRRVATPVGAAAFAFPIEGGARNAPWGMWRRQSSAAMCGRGRHGRPENGPDGWDGCWSGRRESAGGGARGRSARDRCCTRLARQSGRGKLLKSSPDTVTFCSTNNRALTFSESLSGFGGFAKGSRQDGRSRAPTPEDDFRRKPTPCAARAAGARKGTGFERRGRPASPPVQQADKSRYEVILVV